MRLSTPVLVVQAVTVANEKPVPSPCSTAYAISSGRWRVGDAASPTNEEIDKIKEANERAIKDLQYILAAVLWSSCDAETAARKRRDGVRRSKAGI